MRPNFPLNLSVCARRMQTSRTPRIRLSATRRGLRHFADFSVGDGPCAKIPAAAAAHADARSGCRDLVIQVVSHLLKISALPAKAATIVQTTCRRIT